MLAALRLVVFAAALGACSPAVPAPTPTELARQASYGVELEACRHPDSGLYADYERCAEGVDARYGLGDGGGHD